MPIAASRTGLSSRGRCGAASDNLEPVTDVEPAGWPCITSGMTQPDKKPDMQPRELKDGTGWYVYVNWGYRPAEQVGGFPSKDEAQEWIEQNASGWLKAHFDE